MSEPIIIETPATTRERLVLVRERIIVPESRDATPDDLARGGYVLAAFVALAAQRDPGMAHLRADLRDAVKRAEHAEQLTSELQATIVRAFSYIEQTPGVQCLDAEVKKLGERAEKAEGLLIQRETELRLAREDGAAVERQMREARSAADASFVRANQADMRAEKAERELEDAESRAAHMLTVIRERDTLRAELARLTAPGEGSEGEMTLAVKAYSGHGDHETSLLRVYRLGVAHERARQQPAKDRATDEDPWDEGELAEVFMGAWGAPCDLQAAAVEGVRLRRGVAAVAARVRQGRCLIAQAVPCVTCHGHGRIYQPDDALNDDDGATCRACGGTGHERTDAEWLDQAMTVGLAQCDALRRTVAKLTERCEQWEGERNAIAFVLSTTAERRGDYGSLGYATLARLLGEVSQ